MLVRELLFRSSNKLQSNGVRVAGLLRKLPACVTAEFEV